MLTETDHSHFPDAVKEEWRAPDEIYFYYVRMKYGLLEFVNVEPFSQENFPVYRRFARVFEQTYTRFLDLQKAEAQAREAQIEAAVERVRAAAMAMHSSDDLPTVVQALHDQVGALKVRGFTGAAILLVDEEDIVSVWDLSDPGGQGVPQTFRWSFDPRKYPVMGEMWQTWKTGEQYFVMESNLQKAREGLEELRQVSPEFHAAMETSVKQGEYPDQWHAFASFSRGMLEFDLIAVPTDDARFILTKMAGAFDLAYQRYEDLKQAEAQAREAQIEAALERVRSRTMAMQNGEELAETALVLFEQLINLGFNFRGCGFLIMDEETQTMEDWSANIDQHGKGEILTGTLRFDQHPIITQVVNTWRDGKPYFIGGIEDEKELKEYITMVTSQESVSAETKEKVLAGLKSEWTNSFYFGYGMMYVLTPDAISDQQVDIMLRFAQVFRGTYTRFLDLKTAEAQAREARIEAALERVRAKAMAMHDSDDLTETIELFYHQIGSLTVVPRRCGVALIDREERVSKVWTMNTTPQGETMEVVGAIKMTGHRILDDVFQHWLDQKDYYPVLRGNEITEYYKVLHPQIDFPDYPHDVVQYGHYFMFPEGDVYAWTEKKLEEQDLDIYRRFTSVLSLTYRRYFDLKQAEAQAREAQIEAALERVRSRTMGMQHSDELSEVALELFRQIDQLGIETWAVGFNIWLQGNASYIDWVVSSRTGKFMEPYTVDLTTHPFFREISEARKRGDEFFVIEGEGEELEEHYRLLFSFANIQFEEILASGFQLPERQVNHYVFGKEVSLMFITFDHVPEAYDIFKRFGKVFEQTYTRFQDLQRAEEQAREAQIEAALERVRAKAMAMHNSEDLVETIKVFYDQISSLTVVPRRCGVAHHVDKDERVSKVWTMNTTDEGESVHVVGEIRLQGHPILENVFDHWLQQKEYHPVLRGNEIKEYYQVLQPQIEFPDYPNDVVQYGHYFMFPEGDVYAWTEEELEEQQLEIYRRFTSVLSLTFRRYFDLQKAEAQAREAQIEAALERVRSRTMAMHRSEELPETAAVLFDQLGSLGELPDRISIGILKEDESVLEFWVTDQSGLEVSHGFSAALDEPTTIARVYAAMKAKKDYLVVDLQGQELEDWLRFVEEEMNMVVDRVNIRNRRVQTCAFFSKGMLMLSSHEPLDDQMTELLVRFAKVFDQTYTRFLDLQRAEAQAREAQIEAALERVRSRAMGMQHSDELADLVAKVFGELTQLDMSLTRCLIWIFNPDDLSARVWMANQEEPSGAASYLLPYHEHPAYLAYIEAWKNRESNWVYDLHGELKSSWDAILFSETGFAQLPEQVIAGMREPDRVILSATFNNFGVLQTAGLEPLSNENLQVLERFGRVFDLTYTRFHDLQQAEKQARQARIEVALERVRARALAMQEPEELVEVAQVLRQEMGALGVETLETSTIFIYDPDTKHAETWFAIRDTHHPDQPLVADHITMDLAHTSVGREMIKFYDSKDDMASIPMRGEARSEWVNYAYDLSQTFEGFFGDDIPDRIYHLRKFSHGAIGASAESNLSEESWELLGRAASVFSLAYSRFQDLTQARQDLKLLKEEKRRAEEALAELQAAQVQLIHSEKMASLGELTAGIAHEIKNPLNFVNNFSEVSHELLEEMKEELANGNLDEVTEIAGDVISNLEKIIHHGQRADGIVRSMLQHSRGSTSEKELTDLNVLADEYLRLAYHGLRAKDKSFNADFTTDLDEDLPRVPVIPQDIGRVLLNLINNAFYAVTDRRNASDDPYQPTVTVRTQKYNGHVRISVTDNGNGVPLEVREKIFQPFFSTKPTGEGTGLGLSLSYDIVTKGHGGKLTLETAEGQGSTFTIILPIDAYHESTGRR